MISIGTKIKQIDGLVDTKDVTDWENEFIIHSADEYQRQRAERLDEHG